MQTLKYISLQINHFVKIILRSQTDGTSHDYIYPVKPVLFLKLYI